MDLPIFVVCFKAWFPSDFSTDPDISSALKKTGSGVLLCQLSRMDTRYSSCKIPFQGSESQFGGDNCCPPKESEIYKKEIERGRERLKPNHYLHIHVYLF